jgi:hypothetical protein
MQRLFLLVCITTVSPFLFSQSNDFVVVKKRNGRTLKTLTVGSPVIFQLKTKDYVNGWIENIKNDSIFLRIYNRQTFMTPMGFTVLDTVSIYLKPFYYKDISRVKIYYRRRFIRSKLDRIFIGIGAIYFATNIINGAYHKKPVTSPENLKRLGTSLAAVGAGILMRTKVIDVDNHFSTKRHRIVYIKME